MEFSDEFLTFRVTTPGNNQFMGFLPIVYASPDWKKRKKLWRDLTNFNVNHVTPRDPWLVIGDFNSIVSMSEKKGGRVDPFAASARDFKDFILDNDLSDLGFVGAPFTWCNNRMGHNRIIERLNRAGNASWLQHYGSFSVSHLPRIASDHCPLLNWRPSGWGEENSGV